MSVDGKQYKYLYWWDKDLFVFQDGLLVLWPAESLPRVLLLCHAVM